MGGEKKKGGKKRNERKSHWSSRKVEQFYSGNHVLVRFSTFSLNQLSDFTCGWQIEVIKNWPKQHRDQIKSFKPTETSPISATKNTVYLRSRQKFSVFLLKN